MFRPDITTMEKLHSIDVVVYPFSTLSEAIAFYRFKNPTRQRQANFYEKERVQIPSPDTESPRDLWASTCLAIAKVLRTKSYHEGECFKYWHIYLRDTGHGKKFIADHLNIPERQVSKNIEKIEEELTNELILRELLSPDHEENQRYKRLKRAEEEQEQPQEPED